MTLLYALSWEPPPSGSCETPGCLMEAEGRFEDAEHTVSCHCMDHLQQLVDLTESGVIGGSAGPMNPADC